MWIGPAIYLLAAAMLSRLPASLAAATLAEAVCLVWPCLALSIDSRFGLHVDPSSLYDVLAHSLQDSRQIQSDPTDSTGHNGLYTRWDTSSTVGLRSQNVSP